MDLFVMTQRGDQAVLVHGRGGGLPAGSLRVEGCSEIAKHGVSGTPGLEFIELRLAALCGFFGGCTGSGGLNFDFVHKGHGWCHTFPDENAPGEYSVLRTR